MPANTPAKVRREVGRRIAHLRSVLAWTQEECAEALGVSTRYLQAVEAGQENLTLDTLAKIGNALGVTIEAFFRTADEPGTPKRAPKIEPGASRRSRAAEQRSAYRADGGRQRKR